MGDGAGSCPADDELAALVSGRLAERPRLAILRHLGRCPACASAVALAARIDSQRSTPVPPPPSTIDAPDRVGRFEVRSELGHGGMGIVYRGWDPRLRRDVALKRVSPGATVAAGSRLAKEARVLAHLQHPNIVEIYSLERVGSELYIVMELVRGLTLRAWQTGRSRAQILGAYAEAGRGLAAAHRVHVVHRDFKPDNVLITAEDAVRVVDFGLAAAGPDAVSTEQTAAALPYPVVESRTGSNVVMGTPAYMAPEQLARGAASPASDQFSFCVALFEACTGRRPFAGDTLDELARNVQAGRIGPSRLPRRVLAALRRGLSVDPNDRFPAMEDLLDALSLKPRRWFPFALAAAVALALAAAASSGAPRAPIAATLPTPIAAGSVDPRFAEAIAIAVAALDDERDEDARAAADVALGYAHAENDRHAIATALYVRGRAAHGVGDNAAARGDLEQAFEIARARGDDIAAARAATMLVAVEDHVRDFDGASRWVRIAQSMFERIPAELAELERIELDLFASMLLGDQGRHTEALVGLDRCIAAVDTRSDRSSIALLVECSSRRGHSLVVLGRFPEAVTELRRAAALADEHALSVPAKADARRTLADALAQSGHAVEAVTHAEDALRLYVSAHGPLHRSVAVAHSTASEAASSAGDKAGAIEHGRAAVDIFERLMGGSHPDTANALGDLADALSRVHRYDEAIPMRHRVVTVLTEALGADHPYVATALHNLGVLLWRSGRPKEAIAPLRDALAMREAMMGGDASKVANVRLMLASALADAGHLAEGIAQAEAALQIFVTSLGEDHPFVAIASADLGALELERGHAAAAAQHLARALELRILERGEDDDQVATDRVWLSRALVKLGHRDEARALLDRAVASMDDGVARARGLFDRAQLRGSRPAERARARAEAKEAAALYAEAEANGYPPERRAAVEAWLRTHRR